MRFLTYDVETANNKDMGSICSVGWLLVQNNSIIDQGYTLINPKFPFSRYNVKVHGINEVDVQGAPTFSQYWESTLRKLFETSVVISHNASYDIAATEQALRNANLTDFGIDYIDFIPVCKFYLPGCEHYSLPCVSELAGVTFTHHNAQEDARAIWEVAKFLCARNGFDGIEELIIRSHTPLLNSLTNSYLPKSSQCSPVLPSHTPSFSTHRHDRCTIPVEKRDDSFAGFSFCITGDVQDMSREEVERIILEHGGIFKTSVSKKTTFLIVGTYSDYPPDYLSGKHKKALDLISQGHSIQIISGNDFLSMINAPDTDQRIIAVREHLLSTKLPCCSSDCDHQED